MSGASFFEHLRRAIVLSTIAALLTATPVFAKTKAATDTAPPAIEEEEDGGGGWFIVIPDEDDAAQKPKRKPPATNSAIEQQPDAATLAFRAEIRRRQERIDAFKAQLDALDRELELAAEQYNKAVDELRLTQHRVESAETDLSKAQEAYAVQTELLGDRANSIYKDGSFAAFEVILASESLADFITRVKFLNAMGIRDAEIAASLKGQRELLAQRVTELEGAERDAESLEFELKARKIEIMLRIQEREQMYAQAQDDLLDYLKGEDRATSAASAELYSAAISNASAKGMQIDPSSPAETALAYHGVPYLWGGETPKAFDCSGLVLYVFAQHGVTLPHYSGSQFLMGQKIERAQLASNDVVFFGSPIHHVGIYLGGGYYIHAPRTGDFVKISKLADRKDYAGGRRYPWVPRVGEPKGAVKSASDALSSVKQ